MFNTSLNLVMQDLIMMPFSYKVTVATELNIYSVTLILIYN